MKHIVDYFDSRYKPRQVQIDFLNWVEENWENYEVFCGLLPVAAGKSLAALAIEEWAMNEKDMKSSLITPTKQLQAQYQEVHPLLPMLQGKACFTCRSGAVNCKYTKDFKGEFCEGCSYIANVMRCKASPITLCNQHSYLAHMMQRPLIVVDECHNLLDFLTSLLTIKFYKEKDKYPDVDVKNKTATIATLLDWIGVKVQEYEADLERVKNAMKMSLGKPSKLSKELDDLEDKIERCNKVMARLRSSPDDLLIAEKEDDVFKERKQKSIVIAPVKLESAAKAYLWPCGIQKIVLVSATFNQIDAAQLGLSGDRVGYFRCKSNIPPQRRPFVYSPLHDMGYKSQDKNMEAMAKDIQLICDAHPHEKGIVHMTYGMAIKIQKYLKDPRFLFHSQMDKDIQYRQFRSGGGNEILIASGMDEGIDLAGPEFGFQIIAKVQYLSLGDPLIVAKKNEIPDFYVWEAIRSISQCYGRICRGPEDKGVTYFLDSCLNMLYNRKDLWPEWIQDARYKIEPSEFRKLMEKQRDKNEHTQST